MKRPCNFCDWRRVGVKNNRSRDLWWWQYRCRVCDTVVEFVTGYAPADQARPQVVDSIRREKTIVERAPSVRA